MESFKITIGPANAVRTFDVKDNEYEGSIDSAVKFEVFLDGKFVLGLVPEDDFLRASNDPGILDEETINQLITKVDAHYL